MVPALMRGDGPARTGHWPGHSRELVVSTPRVPARRLARRRFTAVMSVVVVSLALGGAAAGCSSMPATTGAGAVTSGAQASSEPAQVAAYTVPMGDMQMPPQGEIEATWAARPDYVSSLPASGQAAYAFALARPDVLQWLPCYCGCTGMGHRSNLDCFFQRREVKGTYQYEEHASYCDICVKTANMASEMLNDGQTMVQVRAAVDSTFGGGAAPGTDTALPPS